MGTRITAKGVSAEAWAREFATPARRGVRGIFFTNTSKEKLQTNYAPGAQTSGVVSGNPTISASSAIFDGMAGGASAVIDTGIMETPDTTLIAAFKPLKDGWPATPATALTAGQRAMPVGNYNSTGTIAGTTIYWSGTTTLSASCGHLGGSGENAAVGVSLGNVNPDVWNIVSVVVSGSTLTIKNHTTGAKASIAIPGARQVAPRSYQVGGGYNPTYGGRINVAASQIHDVALNDQELDADVAAIRKYIASKGITA